MERGWAVAQAANLREDEPHPVGGFVSGSQLGADVLEDWILGIYEALQIIRVRAGHPASLATHRHRQ